MRARRLFLGVAVVGLLLGGSAARATTLDQAIDLALKHDPGLERVRAENDAAQARLRQARAGRTPTVTLEGSAAAASTDFGPFFGFGRHDLTPRSAALSIRQPLFAGGAIDASIAQARAGDDAARSAIDSARLKLIADVAGAFVGVQTATKALELRQRQVEELSLVLDQSRLRFADGESPRTDVDQAQARLSASKAGLAEAQGGLVEARARYRILVGEEPDGLEPVAEVPAAPATLEDAVAEAESHNPGVAAAQAAVRAAEAGVRRAEADRLPTLGLVAQASSVRDQFLPGYRADGVSVGIEGRWTLFSGVTDGKVSEAQAGRRAAEAALAQARDAAEEATIDAWQARRTADAVVEASADQTRASDAALDSVRNEVRVGAKPNLDLLDAEREALAARIGYLQAQAARVVAAYRLKAAVGG